MGLLRRICGAVVLLLSAVGTICCVAGIVGAWLLCHETSERVRRIFDRVDAGLLRITVANENVRNAVGKARADVAAMNKESADLGRGGEKSRRAAGKVRTLIQQQTRPDVDDLGGRLDTLSDASVAIASLLQSVEELPPERNLHLDPNQLKRTADDAHQLSAILQRLEAAVGDSDKDVDPREVAAETSKVEIVLEKCETTLSKMAVGPGWRSRKLGRTQGRDHQAVQVRGSRGNGVVLMGRCGTNLPVSPWLALVPRHLSRRG